jgi:UDP-N-acetylmuramoylalanine--D-glutamate ligase
LVLLGETKEKIKKTALKYNFNNIFMVDNMKEAVKKSFRLSQKGDKVLLSPACASWDMYENYEVRGRDFKKAVMEIKGDSDGKEKIR